MKKIPETPMDWVNEYIDAVDGIYKIMKSVQNGEAQTIHDFTFNSLLLSANKAIKAEAERQILEILKDDSTPLETILEILVAMAPYTL